MINEEKTIDEILDDLEIKETPEGKEVIVKAKEELDVEDDTALAEELIVTVKDDRSMADKIFNLFYPDLSMGTDKTTASKEALTRALELKIQAAGNIIELLKLRQKNRDAKNAVGVFIGQTISPKKAGINIQNIQSELNNDI